MSPLDTASFPVPQEWDVEPDVAHSWGWEPSGAGKVVWFEYATDQVTSSDGRLTALVTGTSPELVSRLGSPV
ncbi:hypothetical protein QBC98_000888 [Kitasatospora acidiphila]